MAKIKVQDNESIYRDMESDSNADMFKTVYEYSNENDAIQILAVHLSK